MLSELGMALVLIDQNPRCDGPRQWGTKMASSEEQSAVSDAYLSGFFKEADAKTYMASADLGVQLGLELLLNVKEATERR